LPDPHEDLARANAQDDGERRVVLTSGTAARATERFAPLATAGFDVVERFDLSSVSDPEPLVDALTGAWAVVADSANPFDESVLARLPHLRVIARTGVGYDAIDVPAAARRGIAVFTTPGTLTETVADFAVGLMLAALRDVVRLDTAVRSGAWRPPEFVGRDLAGSTVAIVGFGQIGRAVARRLAGFGCRIIAVDPLIDDDVIARHGATRLPLLEALPLADVVTLHLALTPQTRGLIGRGELALLRPTAVLVNTSRGAVVDEAALIEALRDGRLAGAALDVFEHEPLPPGHPLAALTNVVLSGHVASSSHAAIARMCDAAVAGLLAVARGEVPVGCLDPAVLR
jgi:phosphoglycerate dehydrogenase-like enzyme